MRTLLKLMGILLPLGIGAGTALLLSAGLIPNPLLYLKADVATLLVISGALLSLLVGVLLLARANIERDIRTRLARARSSSSAEKQRFLKRLDHELKNPLTAAQIALANLDETQPTGEPNASLASVRTQLLRIGRLTADLRKLSDLEIRPIEQVRVDLEELLRQAVETAREAPEGADRQITLSLPKAPWPLPKATGDPDLLLLAVHNLLDNSLKFSRPGDAIEVRAFEGTHTITVEIADTGPGIPEEDMPHIWEELFRGQSARAVSGSGLGLALVSTIVQRHGGQITARSRAGHGTVFSLRLPSALAD